MTRAPFHELSVAEWDRVMAVTLKGPFLCARAVFPYMRQQKSGKIVNISSLRAFEPANIRQPSGSVSCHYVASKTGVIGLTRGLARELGIYGITVNCIAPGSTVPSDVVELDNEQVSRAIPSALRSDVFSGPETWLVH
jgi:3-oxoacyl-[acyl-carrier protein] reductase